MYLNRIGFIEYIIVNLKKIQLIRESFPLQYRFVHLNQFVCMIYHLGSKY